MHSFFTNPIVFVSLVLLNFLFCQHSDLNACDELLLKLPASGAAPAYHDIPLWGQLVVYDTPDEALASLSEEEKEEQYVRLVLVATNRQLTQTLAPGKELCRPRAALYMRVSNTCPFYYLPWLEDHKDVDMDIISSVPHKASRNSMLNAVKGSRDGGQHALRASVRKRRRSSNHRNAKTRALYVYPGSNVVGGKGFAELTSVASRGRRQQQQVEESGESDGAGSGSEHDDDDGDGDNGNNDRDNSGDDGEEGG